MNLSAPLSPTAEFLLSVEAFRSLSASSAERLAALVQLRNFAPGDIILRRGDPGDSMFIVRTGQVFVPVLDENGKQQFLVQLSARHIFGEMALLTGEPRTADVVAGSDCSCITIPRETLLALLGEHPAVASFLTEILGKRLMEQGGVRQVGKYKLVGEIARGGMAVVYEGIHPTLGRPVAIKMLSHALVYQRHFADRFRNEARIIGSLRHPGIVEVFDCEEAYATIFIIMEKLAGHDLERLIEERGPFPPEQVRSIIHQLAGALDYAHRHGIVHRDIKPSNIILDENGLTKIMDFGIAMVPDLEKGMTIDHDMFLGTPLYTSPEQATGDQIDGRADLYSLGLVAFELLTGAPPFDSLDAHEVLVKQVEEPIRPPRLLNPNVPADLNEFVLRATQKRPEDRFQSGREIQAFLSKQSGVSLTEVGVKTLTVLYDHESSHDVDLWMNRVKALAAQIPGAVVRFSSEH